jgi:hypothetical protein
MLHAHTIGAGLQATIVRNGVESKLNINEHYDFNFQT